MGLSPHMRGNLQQGVLALAGLGSIPAHAGEPVWPSVLGRIRRVYPRTCGGTFIVRFPFYRFWGLSPHMRGNLPIVMFSVIPRGSIPAHAGEPDRRHSHSALERVYPRTCGGTHGWPAFWVALNGLSPHMRGNPILPPAHPRDGGSIPAHAGEPNSGSGPIAGRRVYPRTCGGTSLATSSRSSVGGLSPHMRGNRTIRSPLHSVSGSIPAHAGEPRPVLIRNSAVGVYPRTCGGTHRRSR